MKKSHFFKFSYVFSYLRFLYILMLFNKVYILKLCVLFTALAASMVFLVSGVFFFYPVDILCGQDLFFALVMEKHGVLPIWILTKVSIIFLGGGWGREFFES